MLPLLDPSSPARAADAVPVDLLDAESRAALDPGANLRAWIDSLVGAGQPEDALRILGRVLPKRYALAWGCECLRHSHKEMSGTDRESDRVGLALAERWLGAPSEEHRRATLDFAERGEFATPGAWIAAAAGWAEGSLAPKGYTDVAPPDSLCGEAVCAALLTAASDPATRVKQLAAHVARALVTFGAAAARST